VSIFLIAVTLMCLIYMKAPQVGSDSNVSHFCWQAATMYNYIHFLILILPIFAELSYGLQSFPCRCLEFEKTGEELNLKVSLTK